MTRDTVPLKYLGAAMLIAVVLWLPSWFYVSENGSDRFAPASALFTGLALAGVAISIWIQSRQERASQLAQTAELDAQRTELRETLYSQRLASAPSDAIDDLERRILGLAVTPNLEEEFDRLDRYLLSGTSTNLSSETGLRLLEAICRHHFCWSHCDAKGCVTKEPQPVPFAEPFSLTQVGL